MTKTIEPTDNEVIGILAKSFSNLGFPEDASLWLIMFSQALQIFDDYMDGDPVERQELDCLIWNTLVAMPQNPFFRKYSAELYPVIATVLLKWQGSDKVERSGKADARSFVWRAGYYDLVLFVASLVHGSLWATEHADKILNMYGESLDIYLKEEF